MIGSIHIAELITRKLEGTISGSELRELDSWIKADPQNRKIYESATDPKRQLGKLEIYNLFNKDRAWTKLEGELFGAKKVSFSPQRILRYAAAILLPLVIGGISYIYLRPTGGDTLAQIDTYIQPGTKKALLILSDGNSLALENEDSFSIIKEGNASISNLDNQVIYTPEENSGNQAKTVYNELRTPRGGGYNLELADGTKVWLNAGSSLKFPVSFQDSIRRVELEGEAYFEVVHSGSPFIVHSGSMDTRVLGTSFNISAYPEDEEFKTTLVEGKVRVSITGDDLLSKTTSTTLLPDEQATFIKKDAEIAKATVNASDFVSWINGKMEFHNEDLEVVMDRLSRWYDFEYEFDNQEARGYHFSARLNREESISVILEMLEMTTDVRFELKDKEIVVL